MSGGRDGVEPRRSLVVKLNDVPDHEIDGERFSELEIETVYVAL